MKIGIVGLPFSGKTTLFNALTGAHVDTTSYSGGKDEAHQSTIKVPDERVEKLTEIFQPKKKIPATIDYIDLGGLSTSEQKKQGFSDNFLGQIRTVDAILVVVRAYEDDNVPHPLNTIDPVRDLAYIESEFILSDLAIIENRMQRLQRTLRAQKNDQDVREYNLLEKFKDQLENEQPLRCMSMTADEELIVRGYQFLTLKPHIIVANISEQDISEEQKIISQFSEKAKFPKTSTVCISSQIEMEIQQLSEEEAEIFRSDLGLTDSAMSRLIRASYDLLGLLSFFTVGSDEVRAWTITHNTKAPQAAGEIHSDIERGFIRAEVVHYDDFIQRGTLNQCKTDGVLRLEGKEYIVKDGDIISFRFAV